MNTNDRYNNEKKSNVENASKNNVNNTNAENKSGNDEIEFEIKDIEVEPTNVKISGKADIKFEELPSSNTEESKNVLDDYMEDLSDNNDQEIADSSKNETKSNENDQNQDEENPEPHHRQLLCSVQHTRRSYFQGDGRL